MGVPDVRGAIDPELIIDGESVNKIKFHEFLKSLKEVEGTWYCAETKNGGRTGYDARDKDCTVYTVVFTSESGVSKSIIHKKILNPDLNRQARKKMPLSSVQVLNRLAQLNSLKDSCIPL